MTLNEVEEGKEYIIKQINTIDDELNAFLRGHRILNVQRELVNNGQMSCWCCCVEYVEGSKAVDIPRSGIREKVDYRNILSESDFEKFRILRDCRKIIAEEDASILMTSHIQDEIHRKMDFVGVMEDGKLVQFGETLDVFS